MFEGLHVNCVWKPQGSVNLFLRSIKSNRRSVMFTQTCTHTNCAVSRHTDYAYLHIKVILFQSTRHNRLRLNPVSLFPGEANVLFYYKKDVFVPAAVHYSTSSDLQVFITKHLMSNVPIVFWITVFWFCCFTTLLQIVFLYCIQVNLIFI